MLDAIIPHLIRPARSGALEVIVVFAVLIEMAAKSVSGGSPIGLIIGFWFLKYRDILFDHPVRSVAESQALDIDILNPVSQQRPLAQPVILGLVVFLVKGS